MPETDINPYSPSQLTQADAKPVASQVVPIDRIRYRRRYALYGIYFGLSVGAGAALAYLSYSAVPSWNYPSSDGWFTYFGRALTLFSYGAVVLGGPAGILGYFVGWIRDRAKRYRP